jgi:hypothetical protein
VLYYFVWNFISKQYAKDAEIIGMMRSCLPAMSVAVRIVALVKPLATARRANLLWIKKLQEVKRR